MNEIISTSAVVDCDTTVSMYHKLRSVGARVLLDSAQAHPMSGRFSFIGLVSRLSIYPTLGDAGEYLRGAMTVNQEAPNELLPPFIGGSVVVCDPAGRFLVAEIGVVVALDNLKRTLTVMAVVDSSEPDADDQRVRAERAVSQVRDAALATTGRPPTLPTIVDRPHQAGAAASDSVAERRWHFEGDPFDAYRLLRAIEATPYMAYVETDEFALAGAGTHSFVSVHGRVVTARKLGISVELSDEIDDDNDRIEAAISSARAGLSHRQALDALGERLMDICSAYETVEYLAPEYHITATHAISTLRASLRPGASGVGALLAAFEKRQPDSDGQRAMIGFVGKDGQMDSCHLSDCVVVRGSTAELFASDRAAAPGRDRLASAISSLVAARQSGDRPSSSAM